MIGHVSDERTLSGKGWEQEVATAIKILLLLVVLILPVSVRCAFAGIHPVQLEKGADTAKCVECHQDKTEGKDIHPAVGMGCLTCHLIRNTADTTRVNLRTARIATLCFECHADKQPTAANMHQIHAPAAQDCLKCHDPHTSTNQHLLLKATSGEKKDNLCLACHTQGMNVPEKGSRHAALDMGCDTCHVTHKVGEIGKQEFDFHLTKAVPELCLGCHEAKDAKLVAAHQGQPFAAASCTSCHDPHASESPKLLQKYLHPPFEAKSCDTCHQPANNGKVVLTQSDSRALCATCHDEQVKKIDTAKVAHPGAQGDCTQCHNPHAGKYPRFVQPNPVGVCESCHSEEAEIHKTKKVLHQPAFQQGCYVCHTPHGGDHEHLLRADTNHLCLTCHGPNAKGTKVADSSDVTIFDGTVRLPEAYFSKVFVVLLDDRGLGHPQEKHPVGGVLDPTDPQKLRMMTCLSCHTPHGGDQNLLLPATDKSGSLCAQCHASLRAAATPPQKTVNTKDKNTKDKKKKKQQEQQ